MMDFSYNAVIMNLELHVTVVYNTILSCILHYYKKYVFGERAKRARHS